jgi:hypothetical protein
MIAGIDLIINVLIIIGLVYVLSDAREDAAQVDP